MNTNFMHLTPASELLAEGYNFDMTDMGDRPFIPAPDDAQYWPVGYQPTSEEYWAAWAQSGEIVGCSEVLSDSYEAPKPIDAHAPNATCDLCKEAKEWGVPGFHCVREWHDSMQERKAYAAPITPYLTRSRTDSDESVDGECIYSPVFFRVGLFDTQVSAEYADRTAAKALVVLANAGIHGGMEARNLGPEVALTGVVYSMLDHGLAAEWPESNPYLETSRVSIARNPDAQRHYGHFKAMRQARADLLTNWMGTNKRRAQNVVKRTAGYVACPDGRKFPMSELEAREWSRRFRLMSDAWANGHAVDWRDTTCLTFAQLRDVKARAWEIIKGTYQRPARNNVGFCIRRRVAGAYKRPAYAMA